VNSVSLAGRVASLLPNTTAAATDSPQACGHSCGDLCAVLNEGTTVYEYLYTEYLCCASGCWSQGCKCSVIV
jgi:hypothetical protein